MWPIILYVSLCPFHCLFVFAFGKFQQCLWIYFISKIILFFFKHFSICFALINFSFLLFSLFIIDLQTLGFIWLLLIYDMLKNKCTLVWGSSSLGIIICIICYFDTDRSFFMHIQFWEKLWSCIFFAHFCTVRPHSDWFANKAYFLSVLFGWYCVPKTVYHTVYAFAALFVKNGSN